MKKGKTSSSGARGGARCPYPSGGRAGGGGVRLSLSPVRIRSPRTKGNIKGGVGAAL